MEEFLSPLKEVLETQHHLLKGFFIASFDFFNMTNHAAFSFSTLCRLLYIGFGDAHDFPS